MTNTQAYLGGGSLFFTPLSMSTGLPTDSEIEIGWITDISLGVESQTADCLSRTNGTAEVVSQATIKQDYTITFTTSNIASANVAKFLFCKETTHTYTVGDTYHNGSALLAYTQDEAYEVGETVIYAGGIYEVIQDVLSAPVEPDAAQFKRLGGATVKKITAGAVTNVLGRARFVGKPVDGVRRVFLCHKLSLSPNGDMNLASDEYTQLVFTGKCQRTDKGVVDIYEELDDE